MSDTLIQQEKLRLVIGENHPDLAESLAILIDFQPDLTCVGTGRSNAEVTRLAQELRADVYVLDLSLDDGSSIPIMRMLRSDQPDAAIIAYTGHSNPVLTDECHKAGCDAVITKAGDVDELLATIRTAARKYR
ncbi:MAG: response regulator transcription factor [Steroidobacteraceae bacterium]